MGDFDLKRCMEEDGGKCVTASGRPARVICTDAAGPYPVVALVMLREGREFVETYTRDGCVLSEKEDVEDLRNLPRKLNGWVNIYQDGGASNIFGTKERAYQWANDKCLRRIACIDLSKFEEGEGL